MCNVTPQRSARHLHVSNQGAVEPEVPRVVRRVRGRRFDDRRYYNQPVGVLPRYDDGDSTQHALPRLAGDARGGVGVGIATMCLLCLCGFSCFYSSLAFLLHLLLTTFTRYLYITVYSMRFTTCVTRSVASCGKKRSFSCRRKCATSFYLRRFRTRASSQCGLRSCTTTFATSFIPSTDPRRCSTTCSLPVRSAKRHVTA